MLAAAPVNQETRNLTAADPEMFLEEISASLSLSDKEFDPRRWQSNRAADVESAVLAVAPSYP
jgi:hypothetical protein